MIELTVALPMFKAGNIAMVTLEGLCNQKGIKFKWELIVAEEKKTAGNTLVYGKKLLMSYKKRLREVGCERIKYIALDNWIPLSHKWILIYQNRTITPKDKGFVLQAADCYPHSLRLHASHYAITEKGYDWYQQEAGYFYDVTSDTVAYYSLANTIQYHPCALNMTISTAIMGNLREENVAAGVDSWLFNRIKPQNVYLDKMFYDDGLDINGHNVISKNRKKLIVNGIMPFVKCDKKLEEIISNKAIIKLLREGRKNMPRINERFPSVATAILWHRPEKVFINAISSANRQMYFGEHKTKFLDNRDNKYNVPEGFNELVRNCGTDWIDLLGDDDWLSKEYVLSCVLAYETALQQGHNDIVCIVSNVTYVDGSGKIPPQPTWALSPGLWKTEWLLKHPFDEKVTVNVTANYLETMQKEFGVEPFHAFWNFGYFYLQGKDNMSGNKFKELEKAEEEK